ncbi:twin-arginine translocation signal domain-containing protein, partial [Bradyrhizobium sp.]
MQRRDFLKATGGLSAQ